jgi:hypothetical protein
VPSHIEIVNELPLNASLKIDRTALARRAEAGHEMLPVTRPSWPCVTNARGHDQNVCSTPLEVNDDRSGD